MEELIVNTRIGEGNLDKNKASARRQGSSCVHR